MDRLISPIEKAHEVTEINITKLFNECDINQIKYNEICSNNCHYHAKISYKGKFVGEVYVLKNGDVEFKLK